MMQSAVRSPRPLNEDPCQDFQTQGKQLQTSSSIQSGEYPLLNSDQGICTETHRNAIGDHGLAKPSGS